MKPGTENEIEGKIREVKGEVKEKAGHLTNNRDLEEARVSRPRRIGFKRYVWVWPVTAMAGVFAAVLAASPQAPGTVGRDLAANCYQCHGTNGRPVEGMPSIAGKDASSLYQTMLEYKATPERDRNDDIMVPIAKAYTDQQLWDMALYIASLPEHGQTPTAKPLAPLASHTREDEEEGQR